MEWTNNGIVPANVAGDKGADDDDEVSREISAERDESSRLYLGCCLTGVGSPERAVYRVYRNRSAVEGWEIQSRHSLGPARLPWMEWNIQMSGRAE